MEISTEFHKDFRRSQKMNNKIRPIIPGMLLSMVALGIMILTGMWMGSDEEGIREGLYNAGLPLLDSMYKGDVANLTAMVGKSWDVIMRAHVHWAGLGAATLGITLLLLLVRNVPNWYKSVASIALGAGSILYPASWFYIAMNLTTLGKASKDDVHLLAALGIAGVGIGTLMVVGALIHDYFKKDKSSVDSDLGERAVVNA